MGLIWFYFKEEKDHLNGIKKKILGETGQIAERSLHENLFDQHAFSVWSAREKRKDKRS